MKKIVMLISACFIFFYSNAEAALKVDFSAYGSIGQLVGLTEPNTPEDSRKLSADVITAGISIEIINVMSWSKPYYGMGFGLVIGVGLYNQWFGSSYMTNGQKIDFSSAAGTGTGAGTGNKNLIQINKTMSLEFAPMYKFYPTKELAIGIGPSLGIILNSGEAEYTKSTVYSNAAGTGASQYYLSPIAGPLTAALLIDVSVTKFFGNFGLFFGVNLRVPFSPLAVGVDGKAGIKYRFNT